MVRAIIIRVEDKVYSDLVELKMRKMWTWEDLILSVLRRGK